MPTLRAFTDKVWRVWDKEDSGGSQLEAKKLGW